MANTIFTFSITDMSYPSVSFMLYTATSSTAPSESVITIDWGDGSTAETETITWSTSSSSKARTFSHSYASTGTYNVEVTCVSGTIGIPYAGGEGPSIYGDLISLTTGDGLVNIDSASLGWIGYEELYVDNITIGPGATSLCNPFTTSRINEVIIDGGQDLVIDISESVIFDTNIKSVTIGGYISEIPNECFWFVGDLTDVTFGDNVTSIGSRAFYDVADLTDIYFCNSTPPTFESDSFDLSDNTITFHVPTGSLSEYTDAIDALSLAFTYTIEEWDPHPVPPTPPTPTPIYPESYINNRRMQEVINEVRTRLALKQDIMQVTEMPTPSQYELGYAYMYMGATDTNFTHGFFYECVSDGQSTPTYSWQSLSTMSQIEIQVSTMPTASEDYLGKILQFVGTTDSTYTNGFFYKCVSDEQTTPTYSWENVSVSPLPPVASGSNNGLMSSSMYTKLDNITTVSSNNDGLMTSAMYDKLDGIGLATTSDIDAIFS